MNLDSRLYNAAIAGDAAAKAQLEQKANSVEKYLGYTILHTEAYSGNAERVGFILREFAHKNLLTKLNIYKQTALHLAIYWGQTEVAKVLIEAAGNLPPSFSANNSTGDNLVTSFQAFLRQGDYHKNTALHAAVMKRNAAIVKLLIEADPSNPMEGNIDGKTPIYIASEKGYTDIVKVICRTCTGPLNLDGPGASTALHAAVKNGNHDIEVVELITAAARLFSSSSSSDDDPVTPFQAFLRRGDEDMNTALHIAIMQGNLATAKLLIKADPSDPRGPNKNGKTPFYTALERRDGDTVKMICAISTAPFVLVGPDGGDMTALHAVIKNLDEDKNEVSDVIKMIINLLKRVMVSNDEKESEIHGFFAKKIFSKTEEFGQTTLELAVERNYLKVVELILDICDPSDQLYWGPYYEEYWIDDDLISLVPLIYKAKDKGYKSLVKFLEGRYQARAVLYRRLENQVNLIAAITRREKGSVLDLLKNDGQSLVTYADNSGWTALHHAAYHGFDLILPAIVEAQTEFGHGFVYKNTVTTPFYVATQKGYTSTVERLMQLWPSSSSTYTAVDKNGQNILHLAALQSKKKMIQGILNYCSEEFKDEFVNRQDKDGNTPLHLLIRRGCFVPELIRYEGLDIRVENREKWTPPDMLYFEDGIVQDQVRIKMALKDLHKEDIFSSSVVRPNISETKDMIFNEQAKLMINEKHALMKSNNHAIDNCFANAIAGDPISKAALEMEADTLYAEEKTILHEESMRGNTERVGFIVKELASKNLLFKLDTLKQTALHLAAHHGHTEVVKLLIDAAREFPSSSSANHPVSSLQAFIRQANVPKGNTALHLAVLNCNKAIVKLIVEADPNDSHVQNNEGKTPIYIAAENGNVDILKEICTACTALSLDGPGGRTTALHALFQNINQGQEGATDVIRMLVNAAKLWSTIADFEALFSRTDESETTVLQLAMKINYVDAVQLLLQEDPAYQHGREIKRNGLMHLIFKAIDNKYSDDIIKLLSQTYKAGIINPDHRDVVSLILAMKRRDDDTVLSLLGGAKKLVTFEEENGWTPLHYAVYHEFDSIIGAIIEAQEDVQHQFVYGDKVPTPFHVAIERGYASTLVLLMQLWPASLSESIAANSPYTTIDENGRNILHLAALAATDSKKEIVKKEMVQGILKYCPENFKDKILKQKDNNGDTPLHLLISHGCFIPELIKDKGLGAMEKNKKGLTPWEMLYSKNDVIADQVEIKIAIEDVLTNPSAWYLWPKRKEKKTDIWKNIPASKRRIKDVVLDEGKKVLMDARHEQKKKDIERYKMRTNTQIIVTALITTVTFTVGFTMPGGLRQSGELNEGMAVLTNKAIFNAFMVSDALALLLSTCSLFLYFLESMYEDPHQVAKLNGVSVALNIVSVMAMMLTFITGTYLVLSHSPVLAIAVCLVGSLFFVFVIVLLIKFLCDGRGKRNVD